MTTFGHPRTQQNVVPPPTIPSLIGVMLAALHNPNVAWDEYSCLVPLAEVRPPPSPPDHSEGQGPMAEEPAKTPSFNSLQGERP